MLKQSPSRNQRSKSFKVKDALQICLLLATCFWLLYQSKLTYDKKNVSLEGSGKMARQQNQVDSRHALLMKLGRKGLNPRIGQDLAAEFEKREDEDDDDIKLKENDEAKDASGDDEIDREKTEEEEPEQLQDLIDEDDGEKEEASKGLERDNDADVDVTSKNEVLRALKEEN